jgi:hypothetical protein
MKEIKDVAVGDAFEYRNIPFMKTDVREGIQSRCVNLNDGKLWVFTEDQTVRCEDVELYVDM